MSRTPFAASAALLAACILGVAASASAQPAPLPPPGPATAPPAQPAPSAQLPPPPATPPAQALPPAPPPTQPPPPGQPMPPAPGQPMPPPSGQPMPPPPGQPFQQPAPLAPPPPGGQGWQPAPEPVIAPEPPKPPAGVTRDGLPITHRGHISIETSTMELTSQGYYGDLSIFATGVALEASVQITGGTFATARYASAGLALPGNLMGGVDHVFKMSPTAWVTLGGALGVPLAQGQGTTSLQVYGLSGALWNVFEYMANVVPLRLDGGFELARGDFGLRVDLQPVVLFPYDVSNTDPQLIVQHAIEVQYGHTFGVGLRYQGVANSYAEDAYQAALEPFVVARREMGFARLGLLKTLDEDNPVYSGAWGIRFSAGFHLD